MEEVAEQRFVLSHVFNTEVWMVKDNVIIWCKVICLLWEAFERQACSIYSMRALEARSVDALQECLALWILCLHARPTHEYTPCIHESIDKSADDVKQSHLEAVIVVKRCGKQLHVLALQ